jgi:hypothetical protein
MWNGVHVETPRKELAMTDVDISSEAIASNLANTFVRHYTENNGPLLPLRSPTLDDCYTFVGIAYDKITKTVERILLIVRHPRDYETRTLLPVSSHTVDIAKGTATINMDNGATFDLNVRHHQIIFNGTKQGVKNLGLKLSEDEAM